VPDDELPSSASDPPESSPNAAQLRRDRRRALRREEKQRLAEIDKRLAQIERQHAALESWRLPQRDLRARLERIEAGLEAVLRGIYLEQEELLYPQRLTAHRFGLISQSHEDGVTLALLREAGIETASFVEVGCGLNGGNSGFLARELGWSGLMVDAGDHEVAAVRQIFNPARVQVAQQWVTREGIDQLLRDHGITGELDFLGIDIDGNDYWVWEALSVVRPRIVLVECNLLFGPDHAVVVPYDPEFERHRLKSIYFGASLAALAVLAKRKGYRLVAMEPGSPNAYFLRDDVGSHIPGCEPRALWHQLAGVVRQRLLTRRGVADPVADLWDYIKANDLPVVDVAD
jgi:hypothetical protein